MSYFHRLMAGLAVAVALTGSAQAQVDQLAPAVQHIRDLESAGKLPEAISAAQDLLRTVSTQSGADSADAASCLLRISGLQLESNDAAGAAASAHQAVTIDTQKLGADTAATQEAKQYEAAALAASKQYDQATALIQQTLDSARKNDSKDQQITALDSLATLQIQEGKYPAAEANLSSEVALYQASKESDPGDTIGALQDLALVERQNSHYMKAEAVLRQALDISLKSYPAGAPERVESMRDLAFLLMDIGHYAEASRQLTQALDESIKVTGTASKQTASLDTDNALLATDMGDYQRAARLLSAALFAEEKLFGKDSPYLVRTLNALGEANLQARDYKLAQASLERAMQIVKAKTGGNDPYLLERLASVFLNQGKLSKAEPLLNEELHDIQAKEGNDHPDTIVPMLAIANLKAARQQTRDAAAMYDHALKILQTSAGPEHSLTLSTRLRRALLSLDEGDQSAASTAATEITPILAKAPNALATADNLKLLAVLDHGLKKDDEALAAGKRAADIEDSLLTEVLSFTSEQERLAFQATMSPYDVLGTLGAGPELAEAVLRHKGIVLDSLLEDVKMAEQSSDPKVKNDVLALRDAKRAMTDMVLEHGGDPKFEPKRQQLRKDIEELQRELASKGMGGQSRRALSTRVSDVQARIPANTVMIEYVKYNRFNGLSQVPSYGAVVMSHSGAPKWVALSDAKDVDDTIEYYRRAVRSTPSEESMKQILHELYARTWEPAARAFPAGTKYVILCPDSQLNSVSFVTLLNKDNKFIGEQYLVSYVASGRDLVRNLKVVQEGPMVVFANPDFKGQGGSGAETRGINTEGTRGINTEGTRGIGTETTRGIDTEATRGAVDEEATRGVDTEATRGIDDEATRGSYLDDGVLRGVNFEPLPGTAAEGKTLTSHAKSWAWTPSLSTGEQVTRDKLLALHSPRILHIATHGFFLPDRGLKSNSISLIQPQSRMANPMLRSGIALAGAQTTINALRTPGGTATTNGIFTAQDVETLDLNGTWLVTLSACDTGNGEMTTGEGVLGLRRGFVVAGVENLMMTEWPVFDSTTAKMMVDFYAMAHKTGKAPESLAEIQRAWLLKLRKEYGTVVAVTHAGPFIMSFQGAPDH